MENQSEKLQTDTPSSSMPCYVCLHDANQVDGISRWRPKRSPNRKLELQKWKGRLYLVGCIYNGLSQVLRFEAPLGEILSKYGELELDT